MPNRQPARRKSSNEISPQKSFVSHLTHQSTSPVKPHQRQSEAQVAEIGQEYPDVQEERSDLTIKNIVWLPESSTSTQQSLPIDHKTIGVGTDEPNPAATVINYTDQAIQADFSSRPTSAVLRVDDTAVSPPTSSIGHSDKAIETDLTMAIGRDETPTSTSPVNEQPCVRPVLRSHSDFNASQASLISSNTSVYEQLQRYGSDRID